MLRSVKDIDFATLERLTLEGAKSVLSSLGIKMKAKAKKTELVDRLTAVLGRFKDVLMACERGEAAQV